MGQVFIDSRQKQLEHAVSDENKILVGAIKALEVIVSELMSTLALVGIAIVQAGEAHPSKFSKQDAELSLKIESEEVLDALGGVAKIESSMTKQELEWESMMTKQELDEWENTWLIENR